MKKQPPHAALHVAEKKNLNPLEAKLEERRTNLARIGGAFAASLKGAVTEMPLPMLLELDTVLRQRIAFLEGAPNVAHFVSLDGVTPLCRFDEAESLTEEQRDDPGLLAVTCPECHEALKSDPAAPEGWDPWKGTVAKTAIAEPLPPLEVGET